MLRYNPRSKRKVRASAASARPGGTGQVGLSPTPPHDLAKVPSLFRRNKSEPDTTAARGPRRRAARAAPPPPAREAEAAARARAKVPRTRKEQAKAQRAARVESSQKVRPAMKTGDERYYLPRDKGPVQALLRDFVDSRFSFIELMIPLLILTMVHGLLRQPRAGRASATRSCSAPCCSWSSTCCCMRRRLRRELARRFPDESPKGTTYYAVMRSLQMKFMRLPKAQVKIGQELPEHYR